jgi:hypothetical protein
MAHQRLYVAMIRGHQRLLNGVGLEHLGDGRAPEIVRRDIPQAGVVGPTRDGLLHPAL